MSHRRYKFALGSLDESFDSRLKDKIFIEDDHLDIENDYFCHEKVYET